MSPDPCPPTMRMGQLSGFDIPPPLRVIKRRKSMQIPHGSPRRTSDGSLDSDPDRPLTVIKNRKPQSIIRGGISKAADKPIQGRGPKELFRSVTAKTGSSKTWDSATPKADKTSPRRSASLQVGQRPSSLTFLTKLRSFSRSRSLSIKDPIHRSSPRYLSHSSRRPAVRSPRENLGAIASSRDQSLDIFYSGPTSYAGKSGSSDLSSEPSSNIQDSGPEAPDPCILIPHILITAESRSLNDTRPSVWAAIEISGQLFRPRTRESPRDLAHASVNQAPCLSDDFGDASLSRYGYLYDIKIDVLPTVESRIIDIIGDTSTSIITPGSSHLVLAHIQLEASKANQLKLSKCTSDSLMADLESQLGDFRTEYVHVRVNYCHSGFPASGACLVEDGVSVYQTRLETAATGAIRRQNPASLWSPRQTPTASPIFGKITSHWGQTRAGEIMRGIMASRSGPRKAAY
ncbi:hypothetical protein GGS23DRAFT_34478 [Durotheca rogersii]|uniref:uncharacterized protein n=1 Tax=Durotheca rogersii TaxID=419775 RepID=UPI00221E99E1|nr:uncharacterized protein GGS23DRAFT_34478 [Durotheca rogersii]KAI5868521.1 hypothetical protein GGS23DRAFT_34478 [Durotheca rogersii]